MASVKMRDVAAHVGVSVSTVSKILRGYGAFLLGLIAAATASYLPGVVVYPRKKNKTIVDVSHYLDGHIKGLLVRASTPHQEEQLLRLLALSPLPVVAIWSQAVPDTIGYVDVDHRAGAYQAVSHLLTLGYCCILSYR